MDEPESSNHSNVVTTNVESTNTSADHSDKNGTKIHHIQIWKDIRPTLHEIEEMMSSRVRKKASLMKNELGAGSRKPLPPIQEARPGKGASEEDSEEEFYDLERSESDPFLDVPSSDVVPTKDISWKDELECLVRGGVPMALRGEVEHTLLDILDHLYLLLSHMYNLCNVS